MRYFLLTPDMLPQAKETLIRFVRGQGDRRITKQAIKWLAELTPEALGSVGTAVLLALDGNRLAGLLAVADCGLTESFIVVDRRYRQRGIGKTLTARLCRTMPKLYVRVAVDNTPSINLLQSLGFERLKEIVGPTGKPTLWMASGKWSLADIET
jgi:ribosomal protein S18 acetylase RimI-like enzyme